VSSIKKAETDHGFPQKGSGGWFARTWTWSQAVSNAMRKGGAEFQRQKVLIKAAGKWSKEHLRITDAIMFMFQYSMSVDSWLADMFRRLVEILKRCDTM